ncbi:transcription factor of the MADS box [Dispira simplex]|nr:transcription factor of the MADS box [Dispira simplex]
MQSTLSLSNMNHMLSSTKSENSVPPMGSQMGGLSSTSNGSHVDGGHPHPPPHHLDNSTASRGVKRDHTEDGEDDSDNESATRNEKRAGRRKIKIEYIDDKSRRHITFSKRKAGIMKKAYELSTLTGTQVLLLVVSETGLVYTFTTPKLQPLVTKPEGKSLIQSCLNAPDQSPVNDNVPASHTSQQASPGNYPTTNPGGPQIPPTSVGSPGQDSAYAEDTKPPSTVRPPQAMPPHPSAQQLQGQQGYPTLANFGYAQQYQGLPNQIAMANAAYTSSNGSQYQSPYNNRGFQN